MSIEITEAGQRTLSEQVAEEIRVMMLRRRMTGARLAKELNVSAAWISYRLTGQQAIDLNDLERIARVLGVRIVDLLPGDSKGGLTTRSYVASAPGHVPMPDHPIIKLATRIPVQTRRTA